MIKPQNKKNYWCSFDELQGNSDLDQVIDHDFGSAAPPPSDGLSRRRWLQIMGASMAFGSMAGCRYPAEKIVPFAFRPHGRMPGIPDHFATTIEMGGVAQPLLAKSYDGRPIKLDGNPDHPDSMGSSNAILQSMILELYDPDRSRAPARAGDNGFAAVPMEDVVNTFRSLVSGSDVAVLCEPSSSLSLADLKQQYLSSNSSAKWYEFTSVSSDNAVEGAAMAFGSPHRPVYSLADAKIIVAIDADPYSMMPGSVRLARDLTAGRDADHHRMSRIYCVESDFSTTGAAADHRLPVRFSEIGSFLADLEAAIDAGGGKVDSGLEERQKTLAAMADDLVKYKGAGVVIVGDNQPPEVHARAHRINSKLGNIGQTVSFTKLEGEFKSGIEQLKALTQQIDSGNVKTILILGGNPVFYAPSDLKFGQALGKVANSLHLSYYRDETTQLCKWHVNAAHGLEGWGDGRSYDGSICIAQPLIEPLFKGKSIVEFLAMLTLPDDPQQQGNEHQPNDPAHNLGLTVVQGTLKDHLSGSDPEAAWNQAVHDGFIADSAGEFLSPTVGDINLPAADGRWKNDWDGVDPELIFKPCKSIYDGRFANNGWLQELPEFITKLTWDNAALMSPATADELGLVHSRLCSLSVGADSIELPVYVLPGLPFGTICTWLGYGRQAAGRVAGDADFSIDSIGHDIRPLRTSGNWWSVPTVTTSKPGTSYTLACTQDHFRIDDLGRDEINHRAPNELVREGSYDSYHEFLEQHESTAEQSAEAQSHDDDAEGGAVGHHAAHWPEGHHLHFNNFDLTRAAWRDDKVAHKWGMAIDLNKCFGCNACVIACQAENNIPVVGKEQVKRGREMQWMRIDRYFITEEDDREGANPNIAHQPLTCQQCESAPCETVCPVAATTHSDEGLNDMVYNRCIGTRYCGNNCPYKVRRFNYFNFTDSETFLKIPGDDRLAKADLQLQNLVMNPEVTIRSRGVMEKCTYCVQRISLTKIKAKSEGNRPLGPNEITTACQDVCPADAISFGDIQNEHSDVAKAHKNPRAYALLESLNIFPRTRYLARVRNPHPALADASAAAAH